ncbi:MAG: hypothetical protein AMXMBFR33_57870 [Candidatus Xenobia bacterium]
MAEKLEAILALDASGWEATLTRARQTLARFAGDVDLDFAKVEKSGKSAFGGIADGLQGMNLDRLSGQLAGLAEGIVAPFAAAGTAAVAFEAEMRNVNAVAKLSESDFAAFSDRIRTLGQELNLGVGPAESAAAAYDIVSAGFTDAADSQEILAQSIKGAKAGLTDAKVAADVLTSSLAAYGLRATDAARVNDILFRTVDQGKTTYEELAQSFGSVATIAAQNGVSLEELGASIALLTQKGVKTPEAITSIRAAIVALGSPTNEAIKMQQKFGLQINQASLKNQGLVASLNQVIKATGGNSTALRQILGDVNGLNAALGLAGDGGLRFAGILGNMESAAGATDKALAQQQKSFQANLDKFNAALERAGVTIGNVFLPAASGLVQVATRMVDAFDALPGPVKTGTIVVATLTAGTLALGAAALGMVTAVASVASSIAALGGAAGVAAVAGNAFAAAEVAMAVATVDLSAGVALLTVGFAAIAAAAIAAGVAFAVYTKILQDVEAADRALLEIEERRAKALRENGDLLRESAAELQRSGKSSKDLVYVIGGLQDQLEAARRAGNEPLVGKLEAQIRDAQGLKKELAGLEGAQKSASSAAVAGSQQALDADKERKEALSQELHEIELSNRSIRDKIKLLGALAAQYRLEGDERRRVESQIARLEEQLRKQELAGTQQVFDANQKLADAKITALEKELSAGKNVAKQLEAAIQRRTQLEVNAVRARANAELEGEADPALQAQIREKAELEVQTILQKGENSLAEVRKAADDATLRRAKEQNEMEQEKLQLRQEQIGVALEGLDKEAARGRDVFEQQKKLIQERTALAVQAAKKEADAAAQEAQDPATKAAAVENGRLQVQGLEQQGEQEVQDLIQATADQKREVAQDELAVTKQIRDLHLRALKEQAEAGKNVASQIKQELLERLALTEQEIRLRGEAEKAATSSAEQQALIEQRVQAEIQAARQETTKTIEETTKAIEAQQKAQESLSGVGEIQTFEQFLEGQSAQFGIGATRARIEQQKKANRGAGQGSFGIDTSLTQLESASRLGEVAKASKGAALGGGADLAAAASRAARVPVQVQSKVDVSVQVSVDPKTGKLMAREEKREVTANGRGSSFEDAAANMSPRGNLGSI